MDFLHFPSCHPAKHVREGLVRKIYSIGAVAVGVIAMAYGGFSFLGTTQAGYPLAPVVAGPMGALARIAPDDLTRASTEDIERLTKALATLDAAISQAESRKTLLEADKVDALRAEDREAIREVWADLFEPLMTIENLKERYRYFWTIDYSRNAHLHSRAFLVAYVGMCAEVEVGQKLLALVGRRAIASTLFNEAMPGRGIPVNTFQSFRLNLSNAIEQDWVTTGYTWYNTWIKTHLGEGGKGDDLTILVNTRFERSKAVLGLQAKVTAARNAAELMGGEAFQRFMPAQKNVAEWFGDTRVVAQERRLISDAQLQEMGKSMRPGDIIVERRNWYLSNIGLPGFWPHAALYIGTNEDIRRTFDEDPETKARFGHLSEYLEKNHKEAFTAWSANDSHGRQHVVIEAVSEGVVVASIEHSCGADYVGILRPRIPLVDVAAAIDRAFSFYGRPYDFNFDFGTDDQIVCSELVLKAYEPRSQATPGLRIPFVTVAGKRVAPPTELVRSFAAERGQDKRQLDFVYFLDGREGEKRAIVGDANSLAETVTRPKWDIVQK